MKRKNNTITVTVEKTNTGFSTHCNDYQIFTTSKSVVTLFDSALEAINLYFEEDGVVYRKEDLQFEIDFRQFFQYYRVLNAKFLAEKIEMNPSLLSQYVQGNKKPSKKQTEKILRGIHQIGAELSELNLIYS